MLDTIQNAAVIIFGLVLILILLFALKFVHKQARRLKELEREQQFQQQTTETDVMKNEEN